jgi:hypothetical protein
MALKVAQKRTRLARNGIKSCTEAYAFSYERHYKLHRSVRVWLGMALKVAQRRTRLVRKSTISCTEAYAFG